MHPRTYPMFSSQELRDCVKDSETSGLQVQLVDESNPLHWKGAIKGPVGTPYEGGLFRIDIVLPSDYPFVPPKVFHPHACSASARVATCSLLGCR